MKAITFYNEKGNALNGVRKQIKDMVEKNLTLGGKTLLVNDIGELYTQVAVDGATNTPIYAVVTLAISDRDVPARVKGIKKEVETISIPDLFE